MQSRPPKIYWYIYQNSMHIPQVIRMKHIFLHKDSCIYTIQILGLIRTIHVIRNSKSEPNMHPTYELYKITQTVVVTFPWILYISPTLTLSHNNNFVHTNPTITICSFYNNFTCIISSPQFIIPTWSCTLKDSKPAIMCIIYLQL